MQSGIEKARVRDTCAIHVPQIVSLFNGDVPVELKKVVTKQVRQVVRVWISIASNWHEDERSLTCPVGSLRIVKYSLDM